MSASENTPDHPAALLRQATALMRERGSRGEAWHLAVADWLETEAENAAGMDGYEDSDAYPLMLAGFRHPLSVARAYLGETDA